MIQPERHWMAVNGEVIAARADTKDRARQAAEHLGNEYAEVVATPKNGVPNLV